MNVEVLAPINESLKTLQVQTKPDRFGLLAIKRAQILLTQLLRKEKQEVCLIRLYT
jgi:hypothetical protein